MKNTLDRLFSEKISPLRKSFLLIFFLLTYLLMIVLATYPTFSLSEEILYEENFDDNQAQGWDPGEGWSVSGGVFHGEGHSWARYLEGEWEDFRLHIRVCIIEAGSTLHINYRNSEYGRYYIGFHGQGVYLRKEAPPGTFSDVLGGYAANYEEGIWHELEISGIGGHIVVRDASSGIVVILEIEYEDPDPLLSGSIALETLDGSVVEVDDIYVIGPSFVPEPEPKPDLTLQSLRYDITDNRQLEILAEVENIGNDIAPDTFLLAEAAGWETTISIAELPAGGSIQASLILPISDAHRGASHYFEVSIDPENRIPELNEDNNNRFLSVSIPPKEKEYEFILFVAGGAAAVAGASALWYRGRMRRQYMRKESMAPELPPEERIVNTGFSSLTQASEPLDQWIPLAPGQSYYFWFEVGPPIPGSIEVKPEPLMVEFLPSQARLKVVLFTYENEIETFRGADIGQIQIMPDGKVKVVTKVESPESLPPGSDILDRRLFFLIRTPQEEGQFRLRCNIYYEQILVQSRLIQVSVRFDQIRSETPILQSFLEYKMSNTLNPNYLVRMTPQKLSLMLNDNNGTHCLRLYGENDYKNDSCIDARTLESMVELVRGALRKASWSDEEPWTDEKRYRYLDRFDQDQFKEDIINFAIRGYRYWSRIITQLAGPRPEVEKLRDMLRNPTTLEFVVKDKTEVAHLFPPALIYDHPLDTGLRRDKYSVCSSFLEALESTMPLEKAECFRGKCPNQGDNSVVCPSGFWGFRHSIGSPLGSRFDTNHEMLYEVAPELTISVYPSFREWASHQHTLKTLMPNILWNYAETRADTLEKLKTTKPHMVYFYCHGGVKTKLPYIKVGSDEDMVITPDNLDSSNIYWSSPQPLIFINGCHTTSSDPKLAIHFVEKFVISCNASGVIGTEITVFEELARYIAEEFMHRFLTEEQSVGEAIRGARLKLLEKGNPLGLVYSVYASPGLRLKAV